MDGTADFSRLSDTELRSALAKADPTLNPLDWENVRAEVNRRATRRRAKLLPIMERVVGWYLILGAMIGIASTKALFPSGVSFMVPAIALPLILWGAAGICLLRRMKVGRVLGLLALSFQVLSLSFGTVDYHFNPIHSFSIGLINSDVIVQLLGPTGHLRIGREAPTRIAINVVAAYGMIILWRSIRRAQRVS